MGPSFQKFLGWILLFLGIFIILWTLYSSFNIFSAKKEVPAVFKLEKEVSLPKKEVVSPQVDIEKMIREQLEGLFPSEFLPKILNLLAWSIFAGILILGGSQIAGLGIKLLKR